MESKHGGLTSLDMDSTASQSQKQTTSSTQRRMLTASEIELLQKDKRDSFYKMREIFDRLNLGEKLAAKFSKDL